MAANKYQTTTGEHQSKADLTNAIKEIAASCKKSESDINVRARTFAARLSGALAAWDYPEASDAISDMLEIDSARPPSSLALTALGAKAAV